MITACYAQIKKGKIHILPSISCCSLSISKRVFSKDIKSFLLLLSFLRKQESDMFRYFLDSRLHGESQNVM